MMQEMICPLLLASEWQESSKEYVHQIRKKCAWLFFKAQISTGAETSGKCGILQIAEALR
jgi:hypothetical protein